MSPSFPFFVLVAVSEPAASHSAVKPVVMIWGQQIALLKLSATPPVAFEIDVAVLHFFAVPASAFQYLIADIRLVPDSDFADFSGYTSDFVLAAA